MEAYATKYLDKALCICFQDLHQKSDEIVHDFYNRVSDTFQNAYQTKMDHSITFEGIILGMVMQANSSVVTKQGIDHIQLLVLNTVFLV